MRVSITCLAAALVSGGTAWAQSYAPPPTSMALLEQVDWTKAAPIDEHYRAEFKSCDDQDTFLDHRTPERCSSDPNRVEALLKLADGGVLWHSKMSLDVDGSYAATSGRAWRGKDGKLRKSTDQCATALQWSAVPKGKDCAYANAQVDPDQFPYAVIPASKTGFLPAAQRTEEGRRFRRLTRLGLRDMGVIIHGDRWTPAFIADTGPIFRLGEGSAEAFAALGEPRCRTRLDASGRCSGDGSDRYPYINSSIRADVLFIFYPGSGKGLTKANAIARICAFAEQKLGLTGSPACPPAREAARPR